MNKQRKTSNILNVFQYDEATGIIGLNGVPVSGYGLYLHTNINDGSVALDSSANINAMYLLKNGTKQFEISYDTSGVSKLFRLLPYQSGSFFQIGNPSNAGADYVFISEGTYGNVLIGPGIGNGTGNLTGATAATHKIQFNGAVWSNSTIQATGFKVTGGTGFLKADGTVDSTTYITGSALTGYATESYVGTQISNLVDAAPGTLDTLNELAAALGDDPNFATTVSTSIGTKVPQARTITINGTSYDLTANRSWTINSMVYPSAGIALSTGTAWGTSITDNSSNWNTAYGWGNHASGGYLASATAATTYVSLTGSYANPAWITSLGWSKITSIPTTISGYGITNAYTDAQIQNFFNGANAITGYNKSNWDTAYSWGNHAVAGYLTTASAASTYVSLTGSYANPSWITSLAYSKITGVPAFLTSYTETDTLNSVTGRGATTSNTIQVGKLGIGRAAGSNESISIENPEGTWLIQGFRSGSSVGGLHTNSGVLYVQAADVRIQASSTATWNGDTLATRPWVTSQGYLTGITSTQVTNALGYTPYNNSNPAGYITSSGSITGDAGSVGGISASRIVYGDNSTATTYISNATLDGALKSGFYTVGSGGIPNASSVNFVLHTAYYGVGNLAGFDLACNDSTTSQFYLRPATGGGKGAWQTIVTNSGTWGISITGNAATLGGYGPNQTGGANTIVQRDSNGYIQNSYFYTSGGGSERGTGISYIAGFNSGDYYIRSYTLQGLASAMSGVSMNISGNATTANGANGNFYIDDNYGNTVVGVYTSTRYQGVFAMGDAYKLPADGTTTGSLYGLAWSHPNAGGVAGNLNTHGLLVMENGTFLAAVSGSIRARDDMRAPIFYDSNDTAYYLNPAGGSRLRNLYVGDSGDDWSDPGGWGTQVRFSNGPHVRFVLHARSPGIEAGMYVHTPGSVFIGSYTGHSVNMMVGGNSRLLIEDTRVYSHVYMEAAGSMRAPIFYDSNDTGYYVDPNGVSNLSALKIPNASSYTSLRVGIDTSSRIYGDDNRKAIAINADYYPALHLNAYNGTNTTHGAYIVMSGTLSAGGYRLWTMGIANYNPGIFSIGYSDQQDGNGHYGIGDAWSGTDAHHGRLIVDTSGNTKIRGMLYINGTSGGISAGSPVIHAGNIGSQSVNYASNSGTTSQRGFDYLYASSYLETSGAVYGTIFYDNNDRGYYLDPNTSGTSLRIAGNIHSDGSFGTNGYSSSSPNVVSRVFAPKGAAFSSDGSTGAIRIKLPFRGNNPMWTMKVRIYNYATNQTSEYLLGNYAYDQGGYNSSATFLGGSSATPFTVRFGNQDGVDCVWIGETNTSWSYPVVSVLDFTSGFRASDAGSQGTGWNISMVTSFGTIGTTISPSIRFTDVTATSVNAPSGYTSYGNPWGTSNSAFFPNGITTAGGTNWIYGFTYIGNAPGNGAGHEFYTSGSSYSTGDVEAAGSMRAPIFYDRADTSYYCDPNSVSVLHTINSYYYRNNVNVENDHPFGVYFSKNGNSNDYSYAIYRQGGAWSHPYPDLHIAFHTGIKIGAYYGYNGTRFYNNSDWATITASVNDGDNHFRGYYDIIAYASDKRLKHNIQVIDNAVDKVMKLTGMTYQWNNVGSKHGWEPDTETREAGVFAQEVQEVLPEAVKLAPFDNNMGVSKSGENFLTVKYEKIVPLLIEAIKEQQKQIEELQNKLDNVLSSR